MSLADAGPASTPSAPARSAPVPAPPAPARLHAACHAWASREVPGSWGTLRTHGVLLAVSGGADSLALALAAASTLPRQGIDLRALIVDHGLQAATAPVAARTRETLRSWGIPAEVTRLDLDPTHRNLEARARDARHAALARHADGRVLLLGHTASDQAEGVLLGLLRGSGLHALAGMSPWSTEHPAIPGATAVGRPLLRLDRDTIRSSLRGAGITWWEDPHNTDPDFLRSRIRTEVLPFLVDQLGPSIPANLARSATLLHDAGVVNDETIAHTLADAGSAAPTPAPASAVSSARAAAPAPADSAQGAVPAELSVARLTGLSGPRRRAVIRRWLRRHPAGEIPVTGLQIAEIERLVTDWAGQGPVAIPWGAQRPPTMNEDRQRRRLGVHRQEGILRVVCDEE